MLDDIMAVGGNRKPTFPGLAAVERDLRSHLGAVAIKFDRNRTVASQNNGALGLRVPELATSPLLKARLCRRGLSHLTPSAGHVRAGDARNWAMNDMISRNVCRGTATSAIWNVT
jgi:hypothetical protein